MNRMKSKKNKMKSEFKLKKGLNWIRSFNDNLGSLCIAVNENGIYEIVLYNAKINKKETHKVNNGHLVNLEIETDK